MRCLIFAADPVTGFLVEHAATQAGCESLTLADAGDAHRAALDEGGPRLVIVDHAPPHTDGAAWCAALRRDGQRRTLRVILLAPPDDLFDLNRAMDFGVDDVLVKPFQVIELELRLRASFRIIELEAQVEEGQRALRAAATHDLLTGTLNEHAIDEALRVECQKADRDSTPLAAIVIEVDGLGTIRDWTGTEAADAVLVDVAARVRGTIRPYDRLGRAGTAGFLAGLPKCDLAQAVSVANRILTAVSSTPVKGADRMVAVTASIGVTCLDVGDTATPERLVAEAVSAAASARAAGGNRVVTTPPGALA